MRPIGMSGVLIRAFLIRTRQIQKFSISCAPNVASIGGMADEEPGVLPTSRIDAFSDGVFAIALTLLIIDVVAAAKEIEARAKKKSR